MKFLYRYRPITGVQYTNEYLIKESIKNEILAEILHQEKNTIPPEFYQSLVEETRSQLIQELGKINRIHAKEGDFSYSNLRGFGDAFFHKPEEKGYLEEVINSLDKKTRHKIQNVLNIIGDGQGKGFLYGVGMAILVSILLPSKGHQVQSTAYRTAQEGMDIFERGRSIFAKVKEEFEDIIAEASFNSLQKEINDEPQPKNKFYYKNNSDQTFH